ncbi:MAG: caspase domain-containing protein [Chitinophagales bacterium]
MKKTSFTAILLFVCSLLQAQPVKLMPPGELFADTYAVIVGVADYPSSPLDYTDDDAYKFYGHLRSSVGYSVPDENIILLMNREATKANMVAALEAVVKVAKASDRIIFYFTGHGSKEGVIPIDHNNLTNLLEHWEIKSSLKKSPSQNKTCIIDACHAGALGSSWYIGMVSDLLYGYIDSGIALFLASTGDQKSKESSLIRQGYFTYYLLQGMQGGADFDRNKAITLGELHRYVLDRVSLATQNTQTPILAGDYDVRKVLRILP